MTTPTIITLEMAQRHLRLPVGLSSPPTADDVDLQLKVDAAHELVLDYVRQRRSGDEEWLEEIEGWETDTAPKQVVAAILTQIAELWRFRGDDREQPKHDPYSLSPQVTRLLVRLRDPGIA